VNLPIVVAENDRKAEAIARQHAMWVYHVGLRMLPPYWQPPGYTTETSLKRLLATRGKMPTELTYEDLEEGGYIISGSPATVRDKLRVFSDELKAGIVCSGMNGGGHEATLEMMQLFSEEVMPHFREDAAVDETAGTVVRAAGEASL
jgi:alkanesulfonate monooxygenase SsuD/methylene tetrahydromethanopterin reductase-like flavin-dependent oxidoreductase (luciferase family)